MAESKEGVLRYERLRLYKEAHGSARPDRSAGVSGVGVAVTVRQQQSIR